LKDVSEIEWRHSPSDPSPLEPSEDGGVSLKRKPYDEDEPDVENNELPKAKVIHIFVGFGILADEAA
jgi:hypothetical protein